MANHNKFNKALRKLDGRIFKCKTFYDTYMEEVKIGKNEVYLKKDVDELIEALREVHDEQQNALVRKEKIAYDLEIENYTLKRRKKKNEGTNISMDSPLAGQTSSY
jgi:DNA invertase Pin-like site-specific DNA recombinase